ncbi:hypothetical protein CCP3SC15_2050004 [Gammaproteobacteria bacterium]
MVLKAFGIFDVQASCFSPPFFMSTKGQAVRAFTDLVNDHQSTVFKHPEDYRLGQLGTFDDFTGMLSTTDIEWLGSGNEYFKVKEV